MTIFLNLLFITSLFILLGSFGLSFYFIHRFHLKNPLNPVEVGLAFEEIGFPFTDGLTLGGWWIPASGSDMVVINLHGHTVVINGLHAEYLR